MTKKKNNGKHYAKAGLKFILAFIIAMSVFLVVYSATVIAHAPKIETENLYDNLTESSILYDDQGNEISTLSIDGGNRINLTYDKIPKNMVNAVVSIEDKTFWSHNGFNIIRIFGAIKESIFSGEGIGGTSTITQQLARNVFLTETKSVRSLNRKVTEAWYTVLLERNLSKEQIMEAYLNAIYFGHNAYGIESASQTYFNKSAKDLTLLECASLASIPKSPDNYALVKSLANDDIVENSIQIPEENVIIRNDEYTVIYNGEASASRRETTLKFMEKQGYITKKERDAALGENLSTMINLGASSNSIGTSYFCDYIVEEVIQSLVEDGYTEADANALIYTGGLKIHTTLNHQAQTAIETAFNDPSNFPEVNLSNTNFDSQGNIVSPTGNLLLYDYETYLPDGQFVFSSDAIEPQKDGSIVLKKDHRLNFYKTQYDGETEYSVELKPMYTLEDGIFYSMEGGALLIPKEYKSLNDNGDLVISKAFTEDYPEFFTITDGTYSVGPSWYSLKQKVRQPQAAMVICDNTTGAIKAMVGGRNVTGKMLYNRAISPRQTGSSIKPLSVYSAALQQGADAVGQKKAMTFTEYDKNQKTKGYGNFWTAASKINDEKLIVNGKVWPKNAYPGYSGLMTMRKAVEISCNVAAVRVYQQVGAEYAANLLENFGITSLVRTGDTNDMNPSALALGGLTLGISPLEMASAYTTFPNQGTHIDNFGFTQVDNNNGETILKTEPKETQVLNKGVAFIMSDILRTTVTQGIAGPASTGNQVTAGKTGTTSDNYDAWFCGYTPQYSAALWIGNDVNLELTEGSDAAARLWGKIMYYATEGLTGSLPGQPNNVVHTKGEYFISGTEKGVFNVKKEEKEKEKEKEKVEVEVETCSDSGYIATPWCNHRSKVKMTEEDEHAKYYCPVHNQDATTYPIAPGQEIPTFEVQICSECGYLATPLCTQVTTGTFTQGDEHMTYYCYLHNTDISAYPIAPGRSSPTTNP